MSAPAPAPAAPQKPAGSPLGKFLTFLVIVVLGLAAVFFGLGVFVLDGKYDLSRQVTIKGKPADVHKQVGDLTQWPNWLPFSKHDKSVKTTIAKPTGVGAKQEWTSDNGNGELTFITCDENKGVEFDMLFDKKYAAKGHISYTPKGEETIVVWRMHGQSNDLIGKWMAVAMPYMMGSMFDEGLGDLKKKVESK